MAAGRRSKDPSVGISRLGCRGGPSRTELGGQTDAQALVRKGEGGWGRKSLKDSMRKGLQEEGIEDDEGRRKERTESRALFRRPQLLPETARLLLRASPASLS